MHKNKTFATFIALLLGGLGIHRFYLYGWKDKWGWLHIASMPLSILALFAIADSAAPKSFAAAPIVISVLAGFLETLIIGLTPDEKWDARHNPESGKTSQSGWFLAVLLVLALGIGAIALIAAIARTFDLLFTGGSYG